MAAENIEYRFIQNVGDYFPAGYFGEDFIKSVQKTADVTTEEMKEMARPYTALRQEYDKYKNYIVNTQPRTRDAIRHTHDFHTRLLKILGYVTDHAYTQWCSIDKDTHAVVPVRHILYRGSQPKLFVMEMQHMIKTGEDEPAGLFTQRYNTDDGDLTTVRNQQYRATQWSGVFDVPTDCAISPAVINKAVEAIFLLPEERRPRYILMLAGNTIFLLDSEKWSRGAYLQFSLDELFYQASIKKFNSYYALFHLLVSRSTLAADSDTVLMDTLNEESYKKASAVTSDLRDGVVLAVEALANEALYYMQKVAHRPFGKYHPELGDKDDPAAYDETDDDFEREIKDDCLVIVYRLLFIFFAESRPELGILPIDDEVYQHGYSLEMLRDMEMTRLNAQNEDGYFFDDSIQKLFALLCRGHNSSLSYSKSFVMRKIDSPLFDNRRLKQLGDVRIRNKCWQNIICQLSLSKKSKYGRGRISYANLGINQLGSVYESLLAYRGFYAEEKYIEVFEKGKLNKGTYLDTYSRLDTYDADEILKDEDGNVVVHEKGTFIYRLNGRDRKKSASYYTPEVLTRSTVRYTLKNIIDEVAAGRRKATELLDLKILEPAMGAAAFQNEVINQLAEAYLTYQQLQQQEAHPDTKANWRIAPDHYRDELQKVKAYIATHNVYGVDLNPTAIELGKLSLWLNVIHRDMETPFFSNRLALGNAVIGAWLKTYRREEVYGIKGHKGKKEVLMQNPWWDHAPQRIHFGKTSVSRSVNEVYHFLLPDKNMLAAKAIKPIVETPESLEAYKACKRAMDNKLKDWTRPIDATDWATLQRLSGKIDVRLKEYFQYQQSVEHLTQNKMNLWGVPGQPLLNLDSYAEKERLNDMRYRHDNAYFRLRMVMDYWCALWFWEQDEADQLPSREDYWSDIEAMLDVTDEQLDSRTARALRRNTIDSNGQLKLAQAGDMSDMFQQQKLEEKLQTEEESELISFSKEDLLAKTKGANRSFFDDSERFAIAKRLAERYHFFHPMLEFLEVFWLRDGFDIICGNPPFLDWKFEAQETLSDAYPELMIRPDKYDADYVQEHLDDYLTSPRIISLYKEEQTECICCQKLLNSTVIYKELSGGQTDLFKCILLNSVNMLSPKGHMGMIHPDTVFTEAKGMPFREFLYPRLEARYHYSNRKDLFTGVEGKKIFDCSIYRGVDGEIGFDSVSNLFLPQTLDACYVHDGTGECLGLEIVDEDGKKHLNTAGHRDRIIHYDAELLKIVGELFEGTTEWQCCKLVSMHNRKSFDVLKKMSHMGHVGDMNPDVTECLHATNDIKKTCMMVKRTQQPDYENYGMIFDSTEVNILSPFSKLPRKVCKSDSQYDAIDYTTWPLGQDIRTNFVPDKPQEVFTAYIDETGEWFTKYKAGFKKMMDPTHERTLKGGILPPKASHTHSIISASFKNQEELLEFSGLCASVVLDFFVKTVCVRNLVKSTINGLPFGIPKIYHRALFVRVLRLNCINHWYKELWESSFKDDFIEELWSTSDPRLSPFNGLTQQLNEQVPLKNEFERRQALVEIDVLVAMAMGFNIEDLIFMYKNTFSTTQKYEADTWYDKNGRVIASVSSEYDLKIDRPTWERIRGAATDDNTYAGIAPTYTHTIDPSKSELYGGQQVEYVAPYTRCDRIADYRRAWAFFAERCNNQ